jgi:hypothetical protein
MIRRTTKQLRVGTEIPTMSTKSVGFLRVQVPRSCGTATLCPKHHLRRRFESEREARHGRCAGNTGSAKRTDLCSLRLLLTASTYCVYLLSLRFSFADPVAEREADPRSRTRHLRDAVLVTPLGLATGDEEVSVPELERT